VEGLDADLMPCQQAAAPRTGAGRFQIFRNVTGISTTTGWFLPQAPLALFVTLRPTRKSLIPLTNSFLAGLTPSTMNF
jgi:hypothetical protein